MFRFISFLTMTVFAMACTPAVAYTEWVPSSAYATSRPSPSLGHGPDSGYWVILGSVPTHDIRSWESQGRRVLNKASACGFEPFDDLSEKFTGFVPGYDVFVVGPYASLKEASQVRDIARRCIPDAYVKQGRYVGK